jgi:hypothetical protein
MADTTVRAVSPPLHGTTDKRIEADVDLESNEDSSAQIPLGNGTASKTGAKNKVAIKDASSPFLMDEDEDQSILFKRGSRRAYEDDEQDGSADKTPAASPFGEVANLEVSLNEDGKAASSAVRAAGNRTDSKGHGRGRSKQSTKTIPSLLVKDNDLYSSSRAASPVSSLDSQPKLRRNAPRA